MVSESVEADCIRLSISDDGVEERGWKTPAHSLHVLLRRVPMDAQLPCDPSNRQPPALRLLSRAERNQAVWRSKEAAVVKPTDSPLWQAASPRPSATWVLPVPLLPMAMTQGW